MLWIGIASPDHASRIAERMLRPDMFSDWGVRTLSANHVAFDPLAYQQGSVWAFDHALIVSGLRRCGGDAAALRLTAATLDAARGFANGRLPEFIAGMERLPGDAPTHTPRAGPLQAWSAASVPFMVSEMLGLKVDGFGTSITARRPMLPDGVDRLELHDIQVGKAKLALGFTRTGQAAELAVLANPGGVSVEVLP